MPPSSSEGPPAYELLHEGVRRWIWRKGWTQLRDVQEDAIRCILGEPGDLLIAAGTASGKTEAAFLPVCSRLAETAGTGGVRALYVGPLKALINDQFGRMEDLCAALAVGVHRWHGDVPSSRKKALLADPDGVLLITPESLEALLALNGSRVPELFAALGHVVIDELHSFIGIERGRQLQSLLHRVEDRIGRRVPRIGLSATLGDMQLAAAFLRPESPEEVRTLVSERGGGELQLQVRAYRADPVEGEGEGEEEPAEPAGDVRRIARHLFETLRGTSNLIFADSRAEVETYAELLRGLCEEERVPVEFWPHHGSLSRELREALEESLRDGRRPVNALCTTTMEMGIDIGSVTSVAQLGCPASIASLRQRLGRSGRRGSPAVLRIYVREPHVTEATPLEESLHPELVQAVAVLRLLLAGWCEPPVDGALHLSTLVQQLLSLIAERGGTRADRAFLVLCERGPFGGVDPPLFARFLRALGEAALISQMHEGTLVLGEEGERLVNHYSFYAAFESAEEYRLLAGGRPLGQLPLGGPLLPGLQLVFGGRSWTVAAVDRAQKTVLLEPGQGGRPPRFPGGGAPVHDRVRQEMRAVLADSDEPAFLDPEALALLQEARARFASWDLADRAVVPGGDGAGRGGARDVILFPWAGDRVLHTLALQLLACGYRVEPAGIALRVARAELDEVEDRLSELAAAGPPDALELAAGVPTRSVGKHDAFLTDELRTLDYAAARLDPAGAAAALGRMARL